MALLCLCLTVDAQSGMQTIRGKVVDAESGVALIGANVLLPEMAATIGTSTNEQGEFRLEVPIGRHQIAVSYVSYKTKLLQDLLVTAGKELVLDIELEESAISVAAVEVNARSLAEKNRSINPFANVSSRTFSTEETSRYAASVFDPARMAQNFAGVSVASASGDLFNEIVIRGNSPTGILWRLEGIEIPNPNHFGDMGNSGGAISMLSSTTLSNSDFYTAAFPAEFGNATSGVFDLRMRNGNDEKREYAFMFGALGVEFGLEGPIDRNKGSSYLLNYRYSTLALVQAIGLNPTGEILPTYQDLSFNLNFPNSKQGGISIFGLAGRNLAGINPAEDVSQWQQPGDEEGLEERGDMAVLGLKHRKLFKNNSYLKTIIAGSHERESSYDYELDSSYNELFKGRDKTIQNTIRLSSMYHKKISNKTSLRVGAIASFKDLSFRLNGTNPEDPLSSIPYFDNKSNNSFLQAYGQWKLKPGDQLTLLAGLHFSYLTGNSKSALEPRLSARWQINERHEVSFASGLHSKMEHLAIYSFDGAFANGFSITRNNDLKLSKSFHNVLGYDLSLHQNSRIKVELYYQSLFHIPISADSSSSYSALNSFDIYDALDHEKLVSKGKGRNLGVDLTMERSLNRGYYVMLTGSLFDSKYKSQRDRWYDTRFNGGYQCHLLAGKEFGFSNDNSLGINAKFIMSGGARYSEIDLQQSIQMGEEITFDDPPFNKQVGQYLRLDWGIKYQINRASSTHTFMLDIQNTTNRENPFILEYDKDSMTIEQDDQLGMFPFVNYRISF